MPQQAPLRLIKHWRQHAERKTVGDVPKKGNDFEVCYIGVGGLRVKGRSAVTSRLKSHAKHEEKKWSHYSVFEVHDNVTNDEIRELEALLLGIFQHDSRIQLSNTQLGSKKFIDLKVNPDLELKKRGKSTRKRPKQKP